MNPTPAGRHTGNDHDVIVVGGRPAGAATALLLARAGLNVLVIERSATGTDTVSTHALMRPAVTQLYRWGVLDEIVAAGTPAVRTTTFHYGDEAVQIPIKPSDGIDALYAPRRTVLDPILLDAARAARAEVHCSTRLVALSRAIDGRITGVEVATPTGDCSHIRARIVVGADGISSTVARLVGAPMTRRARMSSAYVYAHVKGLPADGYHWYFKPGSTAGVIPTNNGHSCVFIGLPPARFNSDVRHRVSEGFGVVLAELAPAVAEAVCKSPTSRFRLFPGTPGFFRRPYGPGWALVGDAGYFKDPTTAHGITDALRDAELLADAIVAIAYGAEDADALGDYERERNAQSAAMFDITSEIAAYSWDLDRVRQLHLDYSSTLSAELSALLRRQRREAA